MDAHKQAERTYDTPAIAPEAGLMISLVLSSANTAMMNHFLEHVSKSCENYFIVMQVDQIGTLANANKEHINAPTSQGKTALPEKHLQFN